jgi:hypothetical protein
LPHYTTPYPKQWIVRDCATGSEVLLITHTEHDNGTWRYSETYNLKRPNKRWTNYKMYETVGNLDPRGTTIHKHDRMLLLSPKEVQRGQERRKHLMFDPPFYWEPYDFSGNRYKKQKSCDRCGCTMETPKYYQKRGKSFRVRGTLFCLCNTCVEIEPDIVKDGGNQIASL